MNTAQWAGDRGVWHDQWYETRNTGGRFVRSQSHFRHGITADGPFRPEPGRPSISPTSSGTII